MNFFNYGIPTIATAVAPVCDKLGKEQQNKIKGGILKFNALT